MKRVVILALGVFLCIHTAVAQPKVAVLDASLGEGVHPNVASIVADAINEQFVKSPDFIAIDRPYISSIQAEKQFQPSGEVDDSDIKELGVMFGADYICIANVSLLGSTYTVSARLIEVSSAQVIAQESDRRRGEIDVLFTISEVVGGKFVGAELSDKQVAKPTLMTQPEPVRESPPPAPEPEPEKWSPKRRVTVGYMFPGYMGNDGNDMYSGEDYYSFYEQDEYYALGLGCNDASNTKWGFDLHIMMPILNFLYVSSGVRYTHEGSVLNIGLLFGRGMAMKKRYVVGPVMYGKI